MRTLTRILNWFRGPDFRRRGFALLSAASLLAIIMAFMIALVDYLLANHRAGQMFETQIYATQNAEAGVQKALFCLNAASGTKCGGTYGPDYVGESNVVLGGGRYTTQLTGAGGGRTVVSTGYAANGLSRVLKVGVTELPRTNNATQFNHAIQADGLGINLEGNATVSGGPVYSNSNIACKNNVNLEGDVYIALPGGKIDNCDIDGEAHADEIENSDVTGDCFYKDSIFKSDCANKYGSQPTPVSQPMPIIDIDFWRREAERGGVWSGDYAPADNSEIGPLKIFGNLTLGNGVDVVMRGPIWVVGNVYLMQNSSLTLHAAFGPNSTVLLADNAYNPSDSGRIVVENNAVINGSGDAKSFIMIVSTNTSLDDANAAIQISNNAGGSVFYAVNGIVRINNNASATAIAGERGYVDANADIVYQSAYHDPSILVGASGPIGTWRAEPDAWREVIQ